MSCTRHVGLWRLGDEVEKCKLVSIHAIRTEGAAEDEGRL